MLAGMITGQDTARNIETMVRPAPCMLARCHQCANEKQKRKAPWTRDRNAVHLTFES